jgi:anti-anti-sigma regulatory factor
MQCTVEHDGPVHILKLAGTLDVATAPRVRSAVLKCLAATPDAVVLDVSSMTVYDDIVLSLFPAMSRHAAGWPGTTIALAGADDALAASLDQMAVCRLVPAYQTVEQALSDPALARPAPRVHGWLEPVPGSLAVARGIVGKACRSWHIAGLSEVAQLIATELVANVVRHARTEMQLDLALRPRHLSVAVRDRSRVAARLVGPSDEYAASGRGLILVDALAASWGCTRVVGGKAVWATLRRSTPAVP